MQIRISDLLLAEGLPDDAAFLALLFPAIHARIDWSAAFRPNGFRYVRWGCRIAFRFPMVKLLDYVESERWAALEADDNVFALVVMAQIRAKVTDEAETLKGWKFRLIRRMYERGYEQTLILELFRLIDWMIRLPKGLEADFRRELYAYEEQRRMPYVG